MKIYVIRKIHLISGKHSVHSSAFVKKGNAQSELTDLNMNHQNTYSFIEELTIQDSNSLYPSAG